MNPTLKMTFHSSGGIKCCKCEVGFQGEVRGKDLDWIFNSKIVIEVVDMWNCVGRLQSSPIERGGKMFAGQSKLRRKPAFSCMQKEDGEIKRENDPSELNNI